MLGMDYEYVIWDNLERRMVAYGKLSSRVGFMFKMSEKTWEKACKNVALDVLKGTPFSKWEEQQ